jgi:hypothetical protein
MIPVQVDELMSDFDAVWVLIPPTVIMLPPRLESEVTQ